MGTYAIRTFGCQMNKHDSERVAGLLASSGLSAAPSIDTADVVVFMTCCVRENADERALGQIASLKVIKETRPDALVAVGGCIGQRDAEELLRTLPHVDVVFGTHNIGRLPELLARAEAQATPVVEVLDGSDDFASDLPAERERSWHAWVPITVGCDNHCTYCVVPSVRGPERSREVDDILAECRTLAADGVVEITLLGQNVNSYGRDLYGSPRFAEVLSSAAATGVSRVRFATSHPKDLSQETIEIIATTPEVCPYVHLPVQSGSNAVLDAMNRRYTRESYLALVDRMRDQIPNLALSTDIIVGFPGETDADFADTLELVRAIQPDQAFTFIYSPRAGTPAAKMTETVPRELSQERFDRLIEVVHASATAKNAALVGDTLDVLFEGPSKRDQTMLTGRTETNKVVHAPVPDADAPDALVGTIVPVRIEAAQTWFLSGALAG